MAMDLAQETVDATELRKRELSRARTGLRQRSDAWLARVRLAGAVAFVGIAATLGVGLGQSEWRVLVPVLCLYAAFAALLVFSARSEGALRHAVEAASFIDVLVVFTLQRASMPDSPFPAGVAGWTLGVFVLLVLFASLTRRTGVIVVTALVAWACEADLQREAGVGWGAVVASGVILGLDVAATVFAARRLEEVVARMSAQEVSRRLEHERSEALERAAEQVRAAHEELASKHAELVLAQQRAERFSELLVHDLKGPLTSQLTLVELAATNLDPTEHKGTVEDLKIALAEGKRMLGMVQDLLAISRLEEGALRLAPRSQRVLPVLAAIRAAHGAAAQQKGAHLEVCAPGDLEGTFDGDLVHRVVENLVVNALRFVGKGAGIEVSAAAGEGELVLTVANSGKPITPAQRASLFAKQTITPAPGARHNFGLGLTFCRLVVEAHGGHIAVEDVPGWNVAFVIRLPREVRIAARSVV